MKFSRDALIEKKLLKLIKKGRASEVMAMLVEYKLSPGNKVFHKIYQEACSLGRTEEVTLILNLPGKLSDAVLFHSIINATRANHILTSRAIASFVGEKGYAFTPDQEAKCISEVITKRDLPLLSILLDKLKRPLGLKEDDLIQDRLSFCVDPSIPDMVLPLWNSPGNQEMRYGILKDPRLHELSFDKLTTLLEGSCFTDLFAATDDHIKKQLSTNPGVSP